jgi:hypothetical protein
MAGDQETGVTIIELVPELDAGPIAAQRAFPLSWRTTSAPFRRGPASWLPSCWRRRCPSRRCGPSLTRASPTRRRSAPRTASSTGAARRRSC